MSSSDVLLQVNHPESLSKEDFITLLTRLQEAYTNVQPLVEDDVFDYLQSFFEEKFNTQWTMVGFKPEKKRVALKYPMPSLNKIKGDTAEKDLALWNKSFKPPCIIEDKVNGVSLQYILRSGEAALYTRGGDGEGRDVSHLIPYLNLPSVSYDIVIRGELVLWWTDFYEFQQSVFVVLIVMTLIETIAH